MGLVAGPQAHTTGTHSQWVAGPNSTPQRPAVRRCRAPNPDHPTCRQQAPPGRPRAAPTSQLARARAVGCVPGLHAHTARTNSQLVTGPDRTPQGRAVGRG